MDDGGLCLEIKRLIVSELNLKGRTAESIDDDAALFGAVPEGQEGLGLDSLDALQLAMAIEERMGVRIPEDEARSVFKSVRAIADHVAKAKRA